MENTRNLIVTATLAVSAILSTGCKNLEHGYEDSDEMSADLSSVPAAVRTAVLKAAGTNKIESIAHENEAGQDTYEAAFEVDEIEHTVSLKPDGTIIEEETTIKVADLPAAVSAAVLKAQPLAHVKEASMVKRDGQSYFEVDANVGEDKHEFSVRADGTLIADAVEADEKGEHKDKD